MAAIIVAAGLCLPAFADPAKDAYKNGTRAERKNDYDSAYTFYKQAYTLTPNNAKYLAAYTHMRFNAAAQHIKAGQLLRNTGALAAAVAEFQKAVGIDTSSFIAQQELRNTADMLHRQE
jgi:tetratricopeptide (TPR) repeat protein